MGQEEEDRDEEGLAQRQAGLSGQRGGGLGLGVVGGRPLGGAPASGLAVWFGGLPTSRWWARLRQSRKDSPISTDTTSVPRPMVVRRPMRLRAGAGASVASREDSASDNPPRLRVSSALGAGSAAAGASPGICGGPKGGTETWV